MLQALIDFRQRIQKYEEVYETITDRNMHYIKLIDMCVAHNEVLFRHARYCWQHCVMILLRVKNRLEALTALFAG